MATSDPDETISNVIYMNIPWDKVHFFDSDTDENIGYPSKLKNEETNE
jgi:hypothetical protein